MHHSNDVTRSLVITPQRFFDRFFSFLIAHPRSRTPYIVIFLIRIPPYKLNPI
ncbi:hypothetical protein PGTUg99_004063 [Puccinia graminis f. sp. tritici]|uniref:Uncharacterized protein n=1 Tax=Puccinia graminis f. sp. tritici TaxID=56615 RepID=A0A5B0RIS4_PUCGR|nr:hypothetical protein PGTUg99_004063 [Puccinia graminis f. sp. tritici]